MSLDALQAGLDYRFADQSLLERAVTHSSAAGDARRATANNERLEFLGDRVLGLCMAELLYERFPAEKEGDLGRRFGLLVSRDTLAEVAREVGVPAALVIAASERHAQLRDNVSTLSDAMEAILAAVFLDGGIEAARAVVRRTFAAKVAAYAKPPRSPKTRLQEWLLKRGLGLPAYIAEAIEADGHPEQFQVTVIAAGREAQGRGPSKRVAETAAAEAWLAGLRA